VVFTKENLIILNSMSFTCVWYNFSFWFGLV